MIYTGNEGIQTAETFAQWLEQLQAIGNQVKGTLVLYRTDDSELDLYLTVHYGETKEALTGFPMVSFSLNVLKESFLYYVEAALTIGDLFEGTEILVDMLVLANRGRTGEENLTDA